MEKKIKVILISGKAEHGKSTLSKYLKKKLEDKGEKVVTDYFAKYIKMYCSQMGLSKEGDLELWRTTIQKLGTETIKGELNFKSFHAKRLMEDIQIMARVFDIDTFIIDDTRFLDEIYMTKAMFPLEVITIRVNRLGHKSKLTQEQSCHRSETELDNFQFDKIIHHRDTVDHLYDETDRCLKKILKY